MSFTPVNGLVYVTSIPMNFKKLNLIKNLSPFARGFLALIFFISLNQSINAQVSADKIALIEKALPTKASAKPAKPRMVLLYSRTNGFRHGSIPVAVEALKMLGAKTGAYTAFHSEDPALFEPQHLKQFDAVIMVNTTGEIFRPRKWSENEATRKKEQDRENLLKNSLLEFVKNGGGLSGVHSATDTYKNWSEYNIMMGGAFDGHPWHTKVRLRNIDPKHPLNKVFEGRNFEVADEIYQFRKDTADPARMRTLLTLDGSIVDLQKGKRKDGFYPVSWISQYENGRIFYCSLGHRDEIYWNPAVLQHYLDGIQFALGDIEASAKPNNFSLK